MKRMNQRRKETAWKKNRKLGQVKGGRVQVKRNSVIRLLHELTAPEEDEDLPILLQDRPPSAHYWPLGVDELASALKGLPEEDVEGITHLWLRTPSSKMERHGVPRCSLTTGRGVRVIMLHPWPVDRTVRFGRKKPKESIRRSYERFGAAPYKKGRAWFATFTEDDLRQFYVESLLYYCVGDHVYRCQRGVSNSNMHGRRLASFAEDYARRFKFAK